MAQRLDELLADSARRAPETAALADDRVLTYAQLDAQVSRLAAEFRAAGIRPGHRVGVHVSRGRVAVQAIYAVLRAGAVAAPLDCTDPVERTARAARNAGLDFLVASSAAAAGQVREQVVGEGALGSRVAEGLSVVPFAPVRRDPGTDAYILFTSGSTGWPKGVLLTHENVLHFVRWAVRELGVRADDRIGAQAALTFDLSTFDIFGAALAGACAVVLPDELKLFPRDVVEWLRHQRISVFYAVPTLYRALAERGGISAAAVPALRVLAFAGEPFPAQLLEWYVAEFAGRGWWNLYGPTETNVCTGTAVPPGWTAADGLSIGTAVDGLHVDLVEDGQPVQEGEIAVAGPSVFRGYLQLGELHDPTVRQRFADGTTRRAYLTGDLGWRDERGRIWLKGRRDHQVKVRGHRIDLGDVESAAAAITGVRACAAVLKPGDADGPHLALYAIIEGIDERRLRELLAAALPRRMMPHEVHGVAELPLNSRGKTDRQRLAAES